MTPRLTASSFPMLRWQPAKAMQTSTGRRLLTLLIIPVVPGLGTRGWGLAGVVWPRRGHRFSCRVLPDSPRTRRDRRGSPHTQSPGRRSSPPYSGRCRQRSQGRGWGLGAGGWRESSGRGVGIGFLVEFFRIRNEQDVIAAVRLIPKVPEGGALLHIAGDELRLPGLWV